MSELIKESESVVQIDGNDLPGECLSLPTDILRYSVAAADAKRDLDEAKAEQSVVEAELANDIRDRPAAYGLEKSTESAIKLMVTVQPKAIEAEKGVIKTAHQYALLSACSNALDAKKSSVESLIKLHGQGYFAEPRVTGPGKQAVQQAIQKTVRQTAGRTGRYATNA